MNPITTIADEMERDGNACRASSAPEYVVAGDKILGYVKKLRALSAPEPQSGHGVMPANLAHKLQAFAAEPAGTVNWSMIAWSIHRMLNAQPSSAPEPQKEGGAVAMFRICEHCNQEYRLPGACATFLDCPKCGHRDDPWCRYEVAAPPAPASAIEAQP